MSRGSSRRKLLFCLHIFPFHTRISWLQLSSKLSEDSSLAYVRLENFKVLQQSETSLKLLVVGFGKIANRYQRACGPAYRSYFPQERYKIITGGIKMAVDVVEEVLNQRGLLVSAEEARNLMTKWTAKNFAEAASTLQVCTLKH